MSFEVRIGLLLRLRVRERTWACWVKRRELRLMESWRRSKRRERGILSLLGNFRIQFREVY